MQRKKSNPIRTGINSIWDSFNLNTGRQKKHKSNQREEKIKLIFFYFLLENHFRTRKLVRFLFLTLSSQSGVILSKIICELLVWRLSEDGFGPQVWSQVAICGRDSSIRGLSEITKGSCLTFGAGVTIFNTGHLQQLLGPILLMVCLIHFLCSLWIGASPRGRSISVCM